MLAMEWRSRCTVAHPMRSALLIPLLLGSLGGCALVFDDDGSPGDPGGPPEPDTDHPSDPVPPLTAKEVLAEWSGCMSLPNFKTANMAGAWSQITSANGNCTTCHAAGSRELPISSNPEAFFKVLSEHTSTLLLFFSLDLTNPPGKVVIHPSPLQAIGSGAPPHTAHPRFTVGLGPISALGTFYNTTMARKVSGECDPPRLID
jgi:hypothetical protein